MSIRTVLFVGALCCAGAWRASVLAQAQCPESEEMRAQREVEAGLDAFALNLYQLVGGAQAGSNVVLSPLSAFVVLALAWEGARGRSAQQLSSALHLPLNRRRVAQGFQSLMASLPTNQSEGVTLRLANRLYLQSGFEVDEGFQSVAVDSFASAVRELDFADSEAARQSINAWVAAATEGRIEDLIPPGFLSAATRLVLVNALYFSGQWQHQFDEASTAPGPFHVTADESVNASLMHGSFQLRFARAPECNASALILPYRDRDLQSEMVILLPDAIDGLELLESNLAQLDLASLQFQTRQVALTLPRFRIESTSQLKAILQQYGVEEIFTPQSDLSGISDEPLTVSDVIQKAFIQVDENGTEAAAATAVIIGRTTSVVEPQQPIEFRADHPFVFLLRSKVQILFLGRVISPDE